MEKTNIEGTLEKLIHEYKRGEFSTSRIHIREEKTEKQKIFNFLGLVPESLLGKKIIYFEEYFPGGQYTQQIIYEENSSEYILINDGIKA